MQVEVDIVFASLTNRALRHTDFALGNFDASRGDRVGQVTRTDRTKQFAFITRFRNQRQFDVVELLSACLGFCFTLSGLSFKLGTLRFKRFNDTSLQLLVVRFARASATSAGLVLRTRKCGAHGGTAS